MTLLTWSVLVIVYLGGYAATYFTFRYIFKHYNKEPWTVQIKLMCMLFAMLSWLTIMYIALIFAMGKIGIVNLKKEATW